MRHVKLSDMTNRKSKSLNIVGQFVREKREALGISQRSLGLLFNPAVTTQFISNIERGVTPLPTIHIATLVKNLKLTESELIHMMEKEYAAKITNKVGLPMGHGPPGSPIPGHDHAFITRLSQAFHLADQNTQTAFKDACRTILKLE